MAELKTLVSFLDRFLDAGPISDPGLNGLQVEGRARVGRAACAVDASLNVIRRAAGKKADLLIVHHGLYWKGADPRPVGFMKDRLKALLDAGMSLYASHLPLDAHPEVGNNVQFLKKIGLKPKGTFGRYGGVEIGWTAEPARPLTLDRLTEKIDAALGAPSRAFAFSNRPVRRVGVVTGDGAGSYADAVAAGVDTFITGEPAFTIYHAAREQGTNLVFAGHYHTERFGALALAARLGKEFPSLKIFPIDDPVPL